ncbi:hypothetical protein DBR32_02840 [Taibaiella sp. KBW10]|uniref:T9SS type A sorting domain-containing protein n=1 Tax=Taibaiella sp. KBW10 TaxID=2153357 RepID=UPI000F5B7801|nr:T9SS type A sorting domain-containing protein [Taibaiella sp. KBW10]RQO32552.1 hypothetical protein DBR32_02840 [Taibaiella sp. KBW10]
MKKIILLVLSFSALIVQARAQWAMRSASPTAAITQLNVLNKDTLFATSTDGDGVLKSVDGGVHWDTLAFTNASSFKVHFTDQHTGFVAAYAAFATAPTCYKTLDCGQTWQQMNYTISGGDYFSTIHFLNKDTGFVSSMGILGRTINGGDTFTTQELIPESHYITNIHFINQSTGFVSLVQQGNVAYRDMIFKTIDCGNTWTPVYSEIPETQQVFVYGGITQMQFVNSQLGFAITTGAPSKMLKTSDGGNTWAQMPGTMFAGFSLTDVHFISEQNGYVVYNQRIYKTLNGGQTWSVQATSPADMLMMEIEMLDEQTGFASGHGLFKTTNGGGTTAVNTLPAAQGGFKVYPNPSLGDIRIQNEKNIKIERLTLIDATGRVSRVLNTERTTFTFPDLANGTYFLAIQTATGNYIEKIQVLK